MFQEILEESLAQAMQSEHDGVATSYPELSETRRTPAMQQTVTSFDMRNAVDVSLLLLLLLCVCCLLYTSDAADDLNSVDLGGRRIIKKKIF